MQAAGQDPTTLFLDTIEGVAKALIKVVAAKRPEVRAARVARPDDDDPFAQFFEACVEPDVGGPGVQARPMHQAYRAWSEANAKRVRSESKFGREFKKLCQRDDSGQVRVYAEVRLRNASTGTVDETRRRRRRSPPPRKPAG